MTIALICITVIAVLVAIYCATTKKKVDTAASNANKKIYEETERLKKLNEDIKNILNNNVKENQNMVYENNQLTAKIEEGKKHLSTIQNAIDNQQEMSSNAFKNYCDILEKKYKEVEEEHDMEIEALNTVVSCIDLLSSAKSLLPIFLPFLLHLLSLFRRKLNEFVIFLHQLDDNVLHLFEHKFWSL